MQSVIAAAMARSKREIPHYYLGTDIDMHRSLDWLTEFNARRPVTERVLYAALLLKAVAVAVCDIPEMNGYWKEDAFLPVKDVHVGVAIALRDGGLVAPAIHNVEKRSLADVMAALQDLVTRARTGKLRSSELSDATITVTNLGEQGTDSVFGVIYPPQVALVGYTNAGKSTLLNRLTEAGVLVEDRLFATLDPTTRRLELPGGAPLLLTDTVGFVRKLPHQVVEAFKATLELVAEADLVVHLVDAAAPDPPGQIVAVREVLGEIGAGEIPELLAFNKVDRAPDARRLAAEHPGSVAISARSGEGIDALLLAVADRLRAGATTVDLLVPFERGDVLASVHRLGEVLVEEPGEGGIHVQARVDEEGRSRLAPFALGGPDEGPDDLD